MEGKKMDGRMMDGKKEDIIVILVYIDRWKGKRWMEE